MHSIGLVSSRVEFSSQREEGLGVVDKEGDVKYGSWVWNVVLLEVVVKTGPRCSRGKENVG